MHVNVGLALSAVSENFQSARIFHQLPQEIEAHTVRLPRADDVAKPESATGEVEHVTVGSDQRLSR